MLRVDLIGQYAPLDFSANAVSSRLSDAMFFICKSMTAECVANSFPPYTTSRTLICGNKGEHSHARRPPCRLRVRGAQRNRANIPSAATSATPPIRRWDESTVESCALPESNGKIYHNRLLAQKSYCDYDKAPGTVPQFLMESWRRPWT
jgi:hypothetical protein